MDLAERLTLLRKENGLSQLELAEKLGVTRQAVSRWETGASVPSVENLIALRKLYNVSLAYLIGDEEETKPDENMSRQEVRQNKGRPFTKKKAILLAGCIVLVLAIAIAIFALGRKPGNVAHTSEMPTDIFSFEEMETMETFVLKSLMED